MRFELSCAGKVFITGEYSCIESGPALVGTIGPSFRLTVTRDDMAGSPHPFAKQSPAGLFLSNYASLLAGTRLDWHDPYETPIGVGSSSAQFILSMAAVARLRGEPLPPADVVLETYWRIVGSTQGLRPSGVDVLAQWLGGPVVVSNKPVTAQKLSEWLAPAAFVLAFTGKKAKTHEHLLALQERGFPARFRAVFSLLDEITLSATAAWQANNSSELGARLNDYQTALTRGGLAPAEFTAELETVQAMSGVLGCKGSGAQGGDCVLLLVDNARLATVSEALKSRGWAPYLAQWTSSGISLAGNQNG